MQRNANMLKILKKVRFCGFYWFLCKKAVPCLSPRTNFCPSINFVTHYVSGVYKVMNGRKKYPA